MNVVLILLSVIAAATLLGVYRKRRKVSSRLQALINQERLLREAHQKKRILRGEISPGYFLTSEAHSKQREDELFAMKEDE